MYNAKFIEEDCINVDTSNLGKYNIYDGNRTSDSHYKALEHFLNCLDDNFFIYIVDDWNWEGVREGTRRAIDKLNLTVLYKKN
jgi:hypothetical protein